MNEYKQTSGAAPSQDAIDDKLAKLQSMLKMAK
jgi:hypothetical protein